MYLIRFPDGLEYNAFEDELAAIAKATNTQRTPNGTIKDGTWTPNTKGGN